MSDCERLVERAERAILEAWCDKTPGSEAEEKLKEMDDEDSPFMSVMGGSPGP